MCKLEGWKHIMDPPDIKESNPVEVAEYAMENRTA